MAPRVATAAPFKPAPSTTPRDRLARRWAERIRSQRDDQAAIAFAESEVVHHEARARDQLDRVERDGLLPNSFMAASDWLANAAAARATLAILRGEVPVPIDDDARRLDEARDIVGRYLVRRPGEFTERIDQIRQVARFYATELPRRLESHRESLGRSLDALAVGDEGTSLAIPFSVRIEAAHKEQIAVERLEGPARVAEEFNGALPGELAGGFDRALSAAGPDETLAAGLRRFRLANGEISLPSDPVLADLERQAEDARIQIDGIEGAALRAGRDAESEIALVRRVLLDPVTATAAARGATASVAVSEAVIVAAARSGDPKAFAKVYSAILARPDDFPAGLAGQLHAAAVDAVIAAGFLRWESPIRAYVARG